MIKDGFKKEHGAPLQKPEIVLNKIRHILRGLQPPTRSLAPSPPSDRNPCAFSKLSASRPSALSPVLLDSGSKNEIGRERGREERGERTERLIAVGFEESANKIGEGIDRKPRRHHPLQTAPQLYHPTLARASSPVRPPTTTSSPSSVPSRRRRLSPAGVDCLCCTKGPGIGAPLQVSALAVRVLPQLWRKPIGQPLRRTHRDGPHRHRRRRPHRLCVSGGTTQVVAYSEGRYRIFEETIDIAVGNCLDRFARSSPSLTIPAWV